MTIYVIEWNGLNLHEHKKNFEVWTIERIKQTKREKDWELIYWDDLTHIVQANGRPIAWIHKREVQP